VNRKVHAGFGPADGGSTARKRVASTPSDWHVLLWNGNKAGAVQLKEEAKAFLERELKLDLNESKTLVTHIDDGFTFLGFDIRRFQGTHGKSVVLIRPSQKNVRKFKAKIKALTRRDTTYQPAWYKVLQLNQILRGWSAYYQHVNAKATFKKLDWWVLNRIFKWARKKHGRPPWRHIRAKYRHRDPKGRINFVCYLQDGSPIWMYRMADRPIRRYWVNWQSPTYAEADISTTIEDCADCLVEPVSYPAEEQDQLRLLALRRDNNTCQYCGATGTNLHAHHVVPRKQGGSNNLNNLVTLCAQCHSETHRSRTKEKGHPSQL
jgi:RNA-directed DNA polymerase